LKFGVEIALEKAVSVLYTILKTTQHSDTRELQIILAQDKIVNPEISIAIKGI
jgi:pyridoxal/pyridoxine/pyridoxamine kinase